MTLYTVQNQEISYPTSSTTTVVTFSPTPLLTSTGTGQNSVYALQGTTVDSTVMGAGPTARLLALGAIA